MEVLHLIKIDFLNHRKKERQRDVDKCLFYIIDCLAAKYILKE